MTICKTFKDAAVQFHVKSANQARKRAHATANPLMRKAQFTLAQISLNRARLAMLDGAAYAEEADYSQYEPNLT